MGNGAGLVTSGPFANWAAATPLPEIENVTMLYRCVAAGSLYAALALRCLFFRSTGSSLLGDLMQQRDVDWLFSRSNYSQLTACVDPTFELTHGLPHVWVGGYMLVIRVSPNDPIFYLHHTYLDYLWEQFRRQKQRPDQRVKDWAPDEKMCTDSHKLDAPMGPFEPLKNRDGLSEQYTKLWYDYEPSPSRQCSKASPDCGSVALWCDFGQGRCRAKIRLAGNCTGLESTEACYDSACNGLVCSIHKDGKPQHTVCSDAPHIHAPDSSLESFQDQELSSTVPPIMLTQPTVPPPPPPVSVEPITPSMPPTPATLEPSQATSSLVIDEQTTTPYGRSLPNGYYSSPSPGTEDSVYIKTIMVGENGPVVNGVVTADGLSYQGNHVSSTPVSNAIYPEVPGVTYVKIKDPTLKQVNGYLSIRCSDGGHFGAKCKLILF